MFLIPGPKSQVHADITIVGHSRSFKNKKITLSLLLWLHYMPKLWLLFLLTMH